MFNKELKEKMFKLEKENEELNRENEKLKLLLMEKGKEVTQLATEIPIYCAKVVEVEKEKERIYAVLKKITRGKKKETEAELRRLTLHRIEFQKDGFYVEHWIMPVMAEIELFSEALKWWEEVGKEEKKEWKGEVQKIYLQPKVGWIVVRKFKNPPLSTPTL